jgi:hypothetical protein
MKYDKANKETRVAIKRVNEVLASQAAASTVAK